MVRRKRSTKCVCVCVYASLYVCASEYVQAFTGPSKLVLTGFVRPHARTHAHISTRMYLQLDTRNHVGCDQKVALSQLRKNRGNEQQVAREILQRRVWKHVRNSRANDSLVVKEIARRVAHACTCIHSIDTTHPRHPLPSECKSAQYLSPWHPVLTATFCKTND